MQLLGMGIHQLILERGEEIVDRFVSKVWREESDVDESRSREEIIDDLRTFLREVALALAQASTGQSSTEETEEKERASASEHGKQRWRIGYEPGRVAHEYSVLRSCIVDVCRGTGTEVSAAELHQLVALLELGISEAINAYTGKREEELRRKNAELEEVTRLREELLAIVSHDLRNPLNAIGAAGHLLSTNRSDGEAVTLARQYGALIERNAKRMSALISGLLDLEAIRRGGLEVARKEQDLAGVIAEAVEMMMGEAEKKRILLSTHVRPINVVCDRDRIIQVLSNLLGNAIKFTHEGGRVDVSVTADSDVVRISVIDSGPGMRDADVSHVFDRYWKSRDVRSGGLGLGLAIAKGIVAAHGGTIRADNLGGAPGRGAEFSFTLPRNPRDTSVDEAGLPRVGAD
jgi:signal transduction histidine kinase